MTKEDFYLKDLDRCKKVEPILTRLGIKADDEFVTWRWHSIDPNHDGVIVTELKSSMGQDENGTFISSVKTYRKDSLEAALPEKLFAMNRIGAFDFFINSEFLAEKLGIDFRLNIDLIHKIQKLLQVIYFKRGQESLNALADLLILLDENGLLEVKGE